METSEPSQDRNRQILVQAALLGLLLLVAVAVALLAPTVPEVNIELPLAPTITGYPIPLRGGF